MKIASGSAREYLQAFKHVIETMDASKPAQENTTVEAALTKSTMLSLDEKLQVFSVMTGMELDRMEPVTASICLSQEDATCYVSQFVQEK